MGPIKPKKKRQPGGTFLCGYVKKPRAVKRKGGTGTLFSGTSSCGFVRPGTNPCKWFGRKKSPPLKGGISRRTESKKNEKPGRKKPLALISPTRIAQKRGRTKKTVRPATWSCVAPKVGEKAGKTESCLGLSCQIEGRKGRCHWPQGKKAPRTGNHLELWVVLEPVTKEGTGGNQGQTRGEGNGGRKLLTGLQSPQKQHEREPFLREKIIRTNVSSIEGGKKKSNFGNVVQSVPGPPVRRKRNARPA